MQIFWISRVPGHSGGYFQQQKRPQESDGPGGESEDHRVWTSRMDPGEVGLIDVKWIVER